MGDNTVKIALKLLLITLVAGLALGLTNAVTKDPIQEQELAAAEAARREQKSEKKKAKKAAEAAGGAE